MCESSTFQSTRFHCCAVCTIPDVELPSLGQFDIKLHPRQVMIILFPNKSKKCVGLQRC